MLLQGLKVVELATWVAAPGCAGVMADWGADVIKVESRTGDATRTYYPDTAESPGNPIFTMENRGKRGIVLDTARPEGRAALIALLKDADVFITNLRPGALTRARLDYESLKVELPRLIYASVSGAGLTGPEADLPAFDITGFWAKSGAGRATIPTDQEPYACRPGFGDHMTALATLSAVLAAVHERGQTGKGRLVECSLLRTAAYAMGWDLSIQMRFGAVTTTQARKDRPGAIGGFFRTGDDRWICIVQRSPACFANMMKVIGRTDIVGQPRYALPMTDMDVVREVRAMVDEGFGARTYDQMAEALTEADLAWAPLASLADMAASEQAAAAGCFFEVDNGWGGQMLSPASPARFPEGAPAVTRPAPKLGQHTREVLLEAGLSLAEVEALTRGDQGL